MDLPDNVKSALAMALELDGSEVVEDIAAIPAPTISKVLSELLVDSTAGMRLASPVMQGKVSRLLQGLSSGPAPSQAVVPSQGPPPQDARSVQP